MWNRRWPSGIDSSVDFKDFRVFPQLARIVLLVYAKQPVGRHRKLDAQPQRCLRLQAIEQPPRVREADEPNSRHHPGLGQANERKHSEKIVAGAATACAHHL